MATSKKSNEIFPTLNYLFKLFLLPWALISMWNFAEYAKLLRLKLSLSAYNETEIQTFANAREECDKTNRNEKLLVFFMSKPIF